MEPRPKFVPENIYEEVMAATRLSLADVLLSFARNQYDPTRTLNNETMETYIRRAEQVASSGKLSPEQIGDLKGAIARIRAAVQNNASEI